MILEMTASAIIYSSALAIPSRGSSETARFVSRQTDAGLDILKSSLAFGLYGQKAFDDLSLIFEECRTANWDGYQAEPVFEETYQLAGQFLKALPLGASMPAISAEADGHLTMEWYRTPRRTLSVSISPEGQLHYAALLGGSKAYGTEPFFGEVPEAIMSLINRVMVA
ncbi:hypothetical protein DSOUD_0163 [Desulfuromonas soudanensis]|jgi:hypothetical protein|uniref:Uncharacterized protein n=1 Tax=Desulfuromonas soudanensis TaxID=1603606 RepID=A0A0M3QEV3_9BACT|nr:hypothetical protein [Desulfuromonas soudanensis]ALC14963.1 hypothetical protein DSOUD_0163 [Desulfuromonas soudanensis]